MTDERETPSGLLDAVDEITKRRHQRKKDKKKDDDLDLGKVW